MIKLEIYIRGGTDDSEGPDSGKPYIDLDIQRHNYGPSKLEYTYAEPLLAGLRKLAQKVAEETGSYKLIDKKTKSEYPIKKGFIDPPDGRGGFMPIDQNMAHKILGGDKQAPGAIPNGRRVKKVNSDPKDRNQDGALGTITQSIGGPEPVFIDGKVCNYMYSVKWDNEPENIVACCDDKIEEVE